MTKSGGEDDQKDEEDAATPAAAPLPPPPTQTQPQRPLLFNSSTEMNEQIARLTSAQWMDMHSRILDVISEERRECICWYTTKVRSRNAFNALMELKLRAISHDYNQQKVPVETTYGRLLHWNTYYIFMISWPRVLHENQRITTDCSEILTIFKAMLEHAVQQTQTIQDDAHALLPPKTVAQLLRLKHDGIFAEV